jgi:hypothetical protein
MTSGNLAPKIYFLMGFQLKTVELKIFLNFTTKKAFEKTH